MGPCKGGENGREKSRVGKRDCGVKKKRGKKRPTKCPGEQDGTFERRREHRRKINAKKKALGKKGGFGKK